MSGGARARGLRASRGRGTLRGRRQGVGYPKGRPRITPAERRRRRDERARLAAWVRKARSQLGTPATADGAAQPITQDELAKLLGCSRTLVSGWERGTRTVLPEDAAAIEQLLAGRAGE